MQRSLIIFEESINSEATRKTYHYQLEQFRKWTKVKDFVRGMGNNLEKNEAVNIHVKKLLKEDPSKKIVHQLLTKYMDDLKWNYEIKFSPYDTDTPPKRDEIFTKEGYLKVPQKTIYEYRLLLNEKQSTWLLKLLYRRCRSAKLAFSKKLNLFNNKNKQKL